MATAHVNVSDIEQKVADIWREILRVPEELDDATFFELEGASISAIRIVSRIEEEFGIRIDVCEIFARDPNRSAFTRTVIERARKS